MSSAGRILIIVTNVNQYEKVGFRTGLWLGELTHFWDVGEEAGCAMTIASPKGGFVPIDPESLSMAGMAEMVGLGGAVSDRYKDRAFMDRLNDTVAIADVSVDDFDAIYLTGGHGTMFDFRDPALARLVGAFYDAGKLVSGVCHGPVGLLDVTLADGSALLAGRKVTGFSNKEESAASRDDAIPFSLEDELTRRAGAYSKATLPFASHVVEDGRLITGQNPSSAKGVAEAVVKQLRGEG